MSDTPADLIITNAHVMTMEPGAKPAEAIAVRGNRIARVGTSEDVGALKGPETRVVDADGATVLPGFVEAHMHLFQGAVSLGELDLGEVNGFDALNEALDQYGKENPRADVLVGRAVNYNILGEGTRLTRHELDRMMSLRPVFLRSGDYHNAWVNTVALEKAGVFHGHDCEPGSEIVMGDDGFATGELQEFAAMEYVLSKLTEPGREMLGLAGVEPENLTPEQRSEDLRLMRKGLDYCASLGITTIHNMDGNFYQCELLREIEEAGELKCRVEVPFRFQPHHEVGVLSEATRMADAYNSDMLWSGRVKFFMDGVLDAWTAAMIEEYADRPGVFGEPLFDAAHYNAASIETDRRGLQISVHAIGDGAVRMTLDGFEAAEKTNGKRDSRHRVEHIEVIHPDDISRFKGLGAIASMQPIHAPGNGYFPKEPTDAMIGEHRWPYAYAWRTMKEAGAEVVYASDWPVSPVDPLLSIKRGLLRQPWGDEPDQRLSYEDTLAAYTSVGAYTCFKENEFGRLNQGMLADIVLLDGPLPEPSEVDGEWPKVRLTLCDGKITYERD